MDFSNVYSTLLITVVTLLIYVAYSRYKLFQLFKKLGVPGPEPNFIIGNGLEMQFGSDGPAVLIEKWRKKYGKVFGYYMGSTPTLVVTDVELIKQITIKDFQIFTDRLSEKTRFSLDIMKIKALTFENRARWKHVRKTLTPAFSASKLRLLTPIIKRAVLDFGKELTKVASHEKAFDIYDRLQRLTLDVIGESVLALKINCQEVEDNELYENAKRIISNGRTISSFFGWLLTYFPELRRFLKFFIRNSAARKSVRSLIGHLKSVIHVRRGESTVKAVDMLQLMLEATSEDQKLTTTIGANSLTDNELIGNCLLFILGAFETTSATLAYLSFVLAKHPDVQDKVHEEMQENVKDVLNATYEDANNLPYLDQVINETVRLYTPVWAITRVNSQEYVIDGIKIPVDTRVEIPINSIHHDPELWPEPDKFDPERFSPENKVKIHPAAYIPFGIGPRNCIGKRYAMLEIKLTMIRLLQEYRLVPSENFVLERIIPATMYVPKNGVFVKLESRTA